jgi:drug/metabolite transporter (DMT)-like permease
MASSRRPLTATMVAVLTALAMMAFAGNSLLCRLALAGGHAGATSFTAIRIASGALVLGVLARTRAPAPKDEERAGSWASAAALFLYAAPFSFAYLRLPTGVGALVLFGCVQATMIGRGIAGGERPSALVWLGLVVAFGGLVALAAPGSTAPDPLATASMALAGISWAVYSLRGRREKADPVRVTASNFVRAAPLAVALAVVVMIVAPEKLSTRGVLVAMASGALASGVGYSIWYAALRGLSATRAGIVQLVVPALAAASGIVILAERPTLRLVLCGAAILGGVALAIASRERA